MAEPDPAPQGDPLDAAIKLLYCVAIGVNVVILVDWYFDGKLAEVTGRAVTRAIAPLRDRWRQHRTFREQKGHVVWDAMTTVENHTNGSAPAEEVAEHE